VWFLQFGTARLTYHYTKAFLRQLQRTFTSRRNFIVYTNWHFLQVADLGRFPFKINLKSLKKLRFSWNLSPSVAKGREKFQCLDSSIFFCNSGCLQQTGQRRMVHIGQINCSQIYQIEKSLGISVFYFVQLVIIFFSSLSVYHIVLGRMGCIVCFLYILYHYYYYYISINMITMCNRCSPQVRQFVST